MVQLVAPSEALSGNFVLPKADIKERVSSSVDAESTFIGYGVTVGKFGLLLPTHIPSTMVEESLPFCKLPNTPAWLRGMANYYGNIIPLIDLQTLLELPASGQREQRILLIGADEKAFAITVAEPPMRLRLTTADIIKGSLPLPPLIQPFVRTYYKTDQIWINVDLQKFFLALGDTI